MFYPEESLRRGGKFYLCWIADSWPSRFAEVTQSELWSQDIREICYDLREEITNESNRPRPAKRFSLRLSSKLLRGLVRLYQRKADDLLGDLKLIINPTVTKKENKKRALRELSVSFLLQHPPSANFGASEEEDEEIIQNRGNVVANIEEITLKEPTMPAIQLWIDDGFGSDDSGEMRVGVDQSVEVIRAGGLDPLTHLWHDMSRLSHNQAHTSHDQAHASHDQPWLASHAPFMERISDHDITESIGMDLVQIVDLQKETPELPEIPSPAPNDPPTMTKTKIITEAEKRKAEEEIVLQELQHEDGGVRGRARRGLLVDRRCKISSERFRSRLDCIHVGRRCQDSCEDVVSIRVPAKAYFSRPAQGGGGTRPNMAQALLRMFNRELVASARRRCAGREMEEALSRPPLLTIEERMGWNTPRLDFPIPEIERNIINLTNLEEDTANISKRPRRSGYVSLIENQPWVSMDDIAQADKENIPANTIPISESGKSVTAILQEVATNIQTNAETQKVSQRKAATELSETPSGRLDRMVTLGDPERTFIRDQWGPKGTMLKIRNSLEEGLKPLTVETLVLKGPLIPKCRAIAMATCFSSLLRLKQEGYIDLLKDPNTNEIADIRLGPKEK